MPIFIIQNIFTQTVTDLKRSRNLQVFAFSRKESLNPLYSDVWRKAARGHRSRYTRHRVVVEMAPYTELGGIDGHFLPCDQVAVSAVAATPGQVGYPFNYPSKMEVPSVCPAP